MGWNFAASSANTWRSVRARAGGQLSGKRAVGLPAHGDVVVDVDQLAGEAGGEESGDEQRHVAEALQAAEPGFAGGRLERLA